MKWYTILSGIIIPLFALVISPIWNAQFSEKKMIEYHFDQKFSIGTIELNSMSWPGLSILYNGKNIQGATFTSIIFENSGDVPVLPSDFESPIVIMMNRHHVILAAQLNRKLPDNLDVNIHTTDSSVSILPLLLNPKDRFSVQMILDSGANVSSVKARIAGIDCLHEKIVEDNNGVQLILSSQLTPRWSSSHVLYKVSPFMLISIIIALMLLAICTYRMSNREKSKLKVSLLFFISLLSYAAANILMTVILAAKAYFKTEEWGRSLVIVMLVMVASILIMIVPEILDIINKKRCKSQNVK